MLRSTSLSRMTFEPSSARSQACLANSWMKEGYPMRHLVHPGQRPRLPAHAFGRGRHDQGVRPFVGRERSEGTEPEHALEVRPRLAAQRRHGGQAGTGDHDREAQLMDPVQADDEGFEAGRRQMVHLVDGQEHPALVGPGRLADLLEQTAQVAGQVARVGRPGHHLDVEEQGAPVGEGEGEGLEHPERPPVHPLHLLLATQLEEGLAQRHGQAQRGARRRRPPRCARG